MDNYGIITHKQQWWSEIATFVRNQFEARFTCY